MLQPTTPPPITTALAVFGRSMGADCILCVPVKRWLLFSTLVTLGTAACAPAAKDLKTSLEATDSGNIWFASAGTLPRSPDGSRFVPGDPVGLSRWQRALPGDGDRARLRWKRSGRRRLGADTARVGVCDIRPRQLQRAWTGRSLHERQAPDGNPADTRRIRRSPRARHAPADR